MTQDRDGFGVDSFGGRSMRWSWRPRLTGPVVFLGGVGIGSWAWGPVTAALGPEVSVALVDRPGMGTPWPGTLPTLADEVTSLADLLRRCDRDVSSPAVLVAHSMASFHAEALARCHPDLVAGLVLVDGSIETDPGAPTEWGERRQLLVARATRRLLRLPGSHRLPAVAMAIGSAVQSNARRWNDDLPAQGTADFRGHDAAPMTIAESAAYRRQAFDLQALRSARAFPDRPVTVLTAAGDGGEKWVHEQAELATLLDGQQQVLPDSRHLMMDDRPDAIAAAATAMIQTT